MTLTFIEETGGRLELPVVALKVLESSDDAVGVSVRLSATHAQLEQIAARRLFNLGNDAGALARERFSPDRPVELEVLASIPREALPPDALRDPQAFAAWARACLEHHPVDPLLRAGHWQLISATQAAELEDGVADPGASLKLGWRHSRAVELRHRLCGPITGVILSALHNWGWGYVRATGQPKITVSDLNGAGPWTCEVLAFDADRLAVFYAVHPEEVPASRRSEVQTFLHLVNHGLPIASFEIDLEDGAVRIKTGIDASGAALTPPLFRNLARHALEAMKRYGPGIDLVVKKRFSAAEALGAMEMK